jgi:hypothetical protein
VVCCLTGTGKVTCSVSENCPPLKTGGNNADA